MIVVVNILQKISHTGKTNSLDRDSTTNIIKFPLSNNFWHFKKIVAVFCEEKKKKDSHVTCHMSRVTCHMSCVTSH